MPRGGKRAGAGRAVGSRNAATISKEQAREAVRAVVQKHMGRMLQSQIAHAIGIGHLYTRDKSGKFNKIENSAEVDRLLSEGEEDRDYWIFTKDPSVQAFTDLMNRALDKPAEQTQKIELSGEVSIVARLQAARKRLAAAKSPARGE